MSVETTGKPSLLPILDSSLDAGTATPTFSRSGTATRINEIGFIENVSQNIPRHCFNSVTLAYKGVLFEEARQNVLLFSNIVTDGSPSIWIPTNAGFATQSFIPAVDAQISTVARITTSATDGRISQQYSFVSAGVWAFSAYLFAGTISKVKLLVGSICSADADLAAGTVALTDTSPTQGIAATIEPHGSGGWYRVTIVFRTLGPNVNYAMKIQNNSGTAVGNFYAWGAQLESCGSGEANSTSYIPTTTAAVSRGADQMSVDLDDSWFNQLGGEGSLYAEFIKDKREQTSSNLLRQVVNTYYPDLLYGIDLGYYSPLGSPAMPHAAVIQYNGNTTQLTDGAAYTDGTTDKLAASWDTGDYITPSGSVRFSVNGAAALTGTNRSTVGTTMYFGGTGSGAQTQRALNGYVRRVAYFDEALSSADLATLTGGGTITTDPLVDFDFTNTDIEDQTGSLDYPRIAYQDVFRTATITGTSAETGYPADAVQRPETYERWQPTSLPAAVQAALSSSQYVDYCFIAAHNLGTKSCRVKAQFSGDAGNWQDACDSFAPDDDMPILLLFSPQSALYWRLYVYENGSPSQCPTIGVVKMGRILTMQHAIYGGHQPITLSRQTEVRTALSKGGNFLSQNIERSGLQTTASFNHLTAAWVREVFSDFMDDARLYPYGWAWRPSDFPDEVAYVWTPSDIRPSNRGVRNLMQVSIPMVGFDPV